MSTLSPTRHRGGRLAVTVAAVLAAAVAASATPSGAAPRQQPSGVELTVDAGYDGVYRAGGRLPVRIAVTADRLVQGTLEIRTDADPTVWSQAVEVPGASEKDVLVVVPTPPALTIRSVEVRLLGVGEPVVVEAELDSLSDEELVGLLPSVAPADLPAPVTLPMDAGTARFVELDDATLAVPGTLDPLGTLVVGPSDLGSLSAGARAEVLDWIDRGGSLLVGAEPGTEVAGLPDEWQPGAASHRVAGYGLVRLVGGAAAAGRFAEFLEPTATIGLDDPFATGFGFAGGFESTANAMARDAGVENLDIGWLLLFLAVYLGLAGPVTFLLLRRRPMLGWIAVPGLAVLFSIASFVIGSDLRSGTDDVQGTVLETSPGGARATTVVGMVSRNGADGAARFPAGWVAGDLGNVFGGDAATGAAVVIGPDGTDGAIDLVAGGFGVLRGAGLVAPVAGLRVEARSVGDGVEGTVTNDSPYALKQVVVLIGQSGERIGDLAPGEQAEFSLVGNEVSGGDFFSPVENRVWPEVAGFNGAPELDGPVNLSLWSDTMSVRGPNGRARGVVVAAGWTREIGSETRSGSGAPANGRSVLVSRAPVLATPGGPLGAGASRRLVVRGPDDLEAPDDVDRAQGLLFRLDNPEGVAGPFELVVPGYLPRIEVWDGATWRVLADDLATVTTNGVDPSRLTTAAVPDAAVRDGVVWVRAWMSRDFGGDGTGLELRTVGS